MSTAGQIEDGLLNTIRKSDVAGVKSFLAQRVNVNTTYRYDGTPLPSACDRGSSEIVKLLLDVGATVNANDSFYGGTSLTWASSKGNMEIVGLLLKHGAKGKESVLVEGVDEGNTEMVRFLLIALVLSMNSSPQISWERFSWRPLQFLMALFTFVD